MRLGAARKLPVPAFGSDTRGECAALRRQQIALPKIQPNRPFHEQAVSVPNLGLAAGAAVAGRMKHALDYMVKHESASGGCLGSQRR